MSDVLKTWVLLWLLTSSVLLACSKEDGESSHAQSQEAEKTNVCGVDRDGHGDSVFPGLITYEECEELCEPIYEQLVEENGSGVCQFGSERIWEYPYYVDQ